MTVEEYEGVRAHSDRFVVAPGHDLPDIEDVVGEGPAYVVVAKRGAAAAYVERVDPRTRGRRA